MTHYLILAATRIQQWLTRTSPLFLVRGASKALTERTGHDSKTVTMLTALPGLALSDEVADVAGVIVLESTQPVSDDVANRALDIVAAQLPGIEWSAWLGEADTYIEAYRATDGGKRAAWQRRRPPALTKLPLVRVCDGCHDESAVEEKVHAGEALTLGSDCLTRAKHSFISRRDTDQLRPAETFEELATLGYRPSSPDQDRRVVTASRGTRDNHLATIAADGNRIGEFFAEVAKLDNQSLHTSISFALGKATQQACEDARNAVRGYVPYATVEPDVVHYVGGDDVLASVPAQIAWPWVLTLGESFDKHFRGQVADAAKELSTPQRLKLTEAAEKVSLGIGMVFHHVTYPFALASQQATRAEDIAKRGTQGNRSAVAWMDLTAESNIPEMRFIDVASAKPDLPGYWASELPRAARQVLAGLLRPHASHDEDTHVLRGVGDWANRTHRDDLVRLCRENRTPAETLTEIRNDLDRSRWWPKPQEES